MKRSELKEMIKQAMLGEDARTDAEQEGYEDGFKDAKDDIKDKLKDMKVSEAFSTTNMPQMDRLKFYAGTMVKANLRNLGVDLKDPMSTNNAIFNDGVDDIAAMLRDDRDMEAEQHAKAIADQISNKISLEEADEDEEVESEEEISVEDELEVEAAPEVSGGTAEVQDHLEAALEAAIAMGDDKLATQIKNTQIYLTRSQTVSEEDTVEEDLYENRRMLKIAGIIK